MANGNFKANHVWQLKPSNDVWLGGGSGMFTKCDEYFEFLKNAMESCTVCPESTVAQKTAPMFAYYVKTHVLLNADIM